MRFGVLGPLSVWTSSGEAVRIPGAKVRALLCVLLVHEGHPVSADRLVEDLWGASPPRHASGALQAKVSQLRRALEEAEPGGRGLVELGPAGYRIVAADVDAARFTALLDRARGSSGPGERAALLHEAVGLWRGPAHADAADEEFARPAAARLEEARLTALEDLAEARLELGEHQLLVGELGALVDHHPLRERLRAAHLRALYRSGRQSEALESYERLRVRLREDLGVDPGPDLVALHRSILAQDPELAASPAPVRPSTNLPVSLTDEPDGGLVGRSAQIDQVCDLVLHHRLVTLVGTGGVGKTRLALEAARRTAGRFPDGVWLVELARLRPCAGVEGTADGVAEAVAEALGLREDTVSGGGDRRSSIERLCEAVRDRRLLLVLDTCEHLVDSVARLGERLLGGAPGVRALATSHEQLGVAGERVHPVPPLDLPPVDAGTEDLAASGAVRLFVARAAEASPGFTLDADNAAAVAAVCRRLDGIPLALELAATRIRALHVHDLAARLDDRFRALGSGRRTAPPRQRTLRAVIDWSWGLLSEAERAVLRRLAVHRGGSTLASAERVCAGGGVEGTDVLDLLSRLLERSLVVVDEAEPRRYRLLESVADYGLERLEESGEAEAARREHARYHAELAEESEPALRGHLQHVWLRRLDAESANLRAALDWAVEQGESSTALRLAGATGRYWYLRGRAPEARRSLAAALGVVADPVPVADSLRLRAMAWQACFGFLEHGNSDPGHLLGVVLQGYDAIDDPVGSAHARVQCAFAMMGSGDASRAREIAREALTAFRRLGDRWGIAASRSILAELCSVNGDLTGMREEATQAESLFREVGDRWGRLHATRLLAMLAEISGDYETARRLSTEGLHMAEGLGLWAAVSWHLAALGRLRLLAGDFPAATDLHERALRVAQEQAYGSNAAFAANGLALADRRTGRLDAAEARQRELTEWNRSRGYLPGVCLGLAELGFAAELRGDADTARDLHAQGLEVARESGDARAVALALEGLAGAAALGGAPARAARLLGAAAATRESVGAPLPDAERGDVNRIGSRAREALGDADFEKAFDEGRAQGIGIEAV
ncbi:BTAD domain-containing putative transcriptional regulator [Nocardiopsis sp. Huas11]|uniref:BTAD domain-containing putative transcriptional regulator n=1 Tax=Nocardiopsis sp. Huas11 TaxID=2183912 RepID=UPI000EADF57C|nr:BTAD domain-containing putative transcriptional regulator [Nocardiopsis sp. Huas11]